MNDFLPAYSKLRLLSAYKKFTKNYLKKIDIYFFELFKKKSFKQSFCELFVG